MLIFFTTWKQQKPFRFPDVFRGYKNAILGCNGLKMMKKNYFSYFFYFLSFIYLFIFFIISFSSFFFSYFYFIFILFYFYYYFYYFCYFILFIIIIIIIIIIILFLLFLKFVFFIIFINFISCWKLFLFSRNISFHPDFFAMYENDLIRKLSLISKFMKSHTGHEIITIHILPNI